VSDVFGSGSAQCATCFIDGLVCDLINQYKQRINEMKALSTDCSYLGSSMHPRFSLTSMDDFTTHHKINHTAGQYFKLSVTNVRTEIRVDTIILCF
jgi:hypothetical protein